MIRLLVVFLFCLGLSLATLSNFTPIEFSGAKFVALNELDQTLSVYLASGYILETKQLSSTQFGQLRNAWTPDSVLSMGLNTPLSIAQRPLFKNLKSNTEGRQLTIPFGTMTVKTGGYYQENAGPQGLNGVVDSFQFLVSTTNMSIHSTIQSSGRVFVSAPEVRLIDGFSAVKGSEVRVVAQ